MKTQKQKQNEIQTKLLREIRQQVKANLFNKICKVVELEYLIATAE